MHTISKSDLHQLAHDLITALHHAHQIIGTYYRGEKPDLHSYEQYFDDLREIAQQIGCEGLYAERLLADLYEDFNNDALDQAASQETFE